MAMSQDLFVFVKSYKERLDDITYILNNKSKAADIKYEWSTFIEFTIEPVGWRAIWKMSRDLCFDLNIPFPCTVIVTVHEINFKELSSTVQINEVEDSNISLPQMMADVPLVELYPMIEQDNNLVLSKIIETAKVIDCLRFFYNHLWMPWDIDYDEGDSWIASHLEGRLKLHFAMLERQVPNNLAHSISRLVVEGRNIQKRIEDIQDAMSEEMESEESSTKLLDLMELHNRMSILRNQFEIYEKPELLGAFIQRAQTKEKTQFGNENCQSVNYVVLQSCTPEQLIRLANMSADYKLIRTFQSLQETLAEARRNSTISVLPGNHPVHDLGNFEFGGTIRGIEPGVVLSEDPASPCTWNLLTDSLTLTNLTIRMSSVWDIIKVRPGAELVLRDVRVEGGAVSDAIDIFPGGKLTASNCQFIGCRTGVVCDSNTTVQLTNCSFENNNVGIEVKEDCCFIMENCTITGSKTYGVMVKVGRGTTYSTESVNSVSSLKESGSVYKNNAKDRHFDSSTLNHFDGDDCNGEVFPASR